MIQFYSMDILLVLHIFAAVIFGGFIFADRLIIRRTFDQNTLKPLYKNAILPTAIAALALIVSGCFLWRNMPLLNLKAAFGLTTIALFFCCPLADRFGRKTRFLYRAIALFALIMTIVLAKMARS